MAYHGPCSLILPVNGRCSLADRSRPIHLVRDIVMGWLSSRFLKTALIGAAVAFANPVYAEDLLDIYRLALINDSQYKAARANYEAALVDLPLARTGFRPSVTSSGTLGRQRSDRTGTTNTSDNSQLQVDLELPIYDRSKSIAIDQASLVEERATLEFDIAQDDLVLRVAESYFNLLAARDAREVARLQKVAIKRQMDLAAERLDVGLGTRTDLFDARARYQQANADLIAAQIAIDNARQALVEIIGVTPESVRGLDENSPLDTPEPNDLQFWVNQSRASNLQVQVEDINLRVASEEIDLQRAARYPTVSIGATQSYNDGSSDEFTSGDYTTRSIGVNVNLPIYLGGSIGLRTKQAGMRFNASEQVLESARRSARSDTTDAFLAVTSGISQVKALKEAIVAGESALEAKEEGFGAGLTTNLDVLDAQRDLSQSRTDYLRARYNYIISLLRLEQAVGDLGQEDVEYINQWLTDITNGSLMSAPEPDESDEEGSGAEYNQDGGQ